MDSQQVEQLLNDIKAFRNVCGEKLAKKLNLDLTERIVNHLASFSAECTDCEHDLQMLKIHIEKLTTEEMPITKEILKEHRRLMEKISAHLRKKHNLADEGTYIAMFSLLGPTLGFILGLTAFDSVSLGLLSGVCLGVLFGAVMEMNARKKGKII